MATPIQSKQNVLLKHWRAVCGVLNLNHSDWKSFSIGQFNLILNYICCNRNGCYYYKAPAWDRDSLFEFSFTVFAKLMFVFPEQHIQIASNVFTCCSKLRQVDTFALGLMCYALYHLVLTKTLSDLPKDILINVITRYIF